jgi:hypothetical protein
MNLTNLIFWSASVITALVGVHNIDSIQRAIWKAQARIIYESRTETWGSPRFLVLEQKSREVNPKNISGRVDAPTR